MMLHDVLDRDGWHVCSVLGKSMLAGMYYLAGGTALALQLQHRRSYLFRMGMNDRINFHTILGELKSGISETDIRVLQRKTHGCTA